MPLVPIGSLGKTHGLDGKLRIRISPEFIDLCKKAKALFVEKAGEKLPYFLSDLSLEASGSGILLFDEISSPESAKTLVGSELFLELSEETITELMDSDALTEEALVNYLMLKQESDGTILPIGKITGVILNTAQFLAEVDMQGKNILIPLEESWIIELNHEKMEITMQLPEGLLDLND